MCKLSKTSGDCHFAFKDLFSKSAIRLDFGFKLCFDILGELFEVRVHTLILDKYADAVSQAEGETIFPGWIMSAHVFAYDCVKDRRLFRW